MIIFMVLLAILAGVLLAVQGPVNASLGKITGRIRATVISFFVGDCTVALLMLCFGKGDLRLITQTSLWQLLGGAIGALYVFVNIACLPVLGAALTIAGVMLGQLIITACIDGFGLLETQAIPVTPLRLCGIVSVAFGIVLVYLGTRDPSGKRNVRSLPVLLFVILSGIINGMQSPINASLAGVIGRWESTFVSFSTGLIIAFAGMLIVMAVKKPGRKNTGDSRSAVSHPEADSTEPLTKFSREKAPIAKDRVFWIYTGGLYGAFAIFFNLTAVASLGAALQVVCGMIGQVGASLVIDSLGLLRVRKVKITLSRGLGAVLIAVGVILVSIARMTA